MPLSWCCFEWSGPAAIEQPATTHAQTRLTDVHIQNRFSHYWLQILYLTDLVLYIYIYIYTHICICLLPQSRLNCNLQMHFPCAHIIAILLVSVGIQMLYSRTVQQRLSGVVILNNTCKHCLTATSQINQQRTGNNTHTCTVHSDMNTHKQHTIQMKSVLLVLQ